MNLDPAHTLAGLPAPVRAWLEQRLVAAHTGHGGPGARLLTMVLARLGWRLAPARARTRRAR